jgi:hypothetical protein
VGTAAAWVIFLIALMQAATAWRLGFIANGLARVIAFLPNVIAAVLIFGGSWLLGNWVADRLRARPADNRPGQEQMVTILPGAVRAGVLTIGAFVALRQILVAPEILVIGFTLVFGAIALATALAFGLGGRRAAERMTEDWYDNRRTGNRTVTGLEEEEHTADFDPPQIHHS